GSARVILSRGRGWPITPVEAGSTRDSGICSKPAVILALSRASASPAGPVQALALPAFTTMAWALPDLRRSRLRSTGAALTRLVVRTPAPAAGASAAIRARSRAPVFLRPAAVAAKRNPGIITAHLPGKFTTGKRRTKRKNRNTGGTPAPLKLFNPASVHSAIRGRPSGSPLLMWVGGW